MTGVGRKGDGHYAPGDLLYPQLARCDINANTEKQLNSLQNLFVHLLPQVGRGSPVAALLWDTALLDTRLIIWREKLMMIVHIRSLGEETLARQIYKEQKSKE